MELQQLSPKRKGKQHLCPEPNAIPMCFGALGNKAVRIGSTTQLLRLGSYALLEMSLSIAMISLVLSMSAWIWHVQEMWKKRTSFAAEFITAQDLLDDLRAGKKFSGQVNESLKTHATIGDLQVISFQLSDGTEIFSLVPHQGPIRP